jgi:hypothetical protein
VPCKRLGHGLPIVPRTTSISSSHTATRCCATACRPPCAKSGRERAQHPRRLRGRRDRDVRFTARAPHGAVQAAFPQTASPPSCQIGATLSRSSGSYSLG